MISRNHTLDPSHPSVGDHRYGTHAIVSAAHQIDLLLAALPTDHELQLQQVTFVAAAPVPQACEAIVLVDAGAAEVSIAGVTTCRASVAAMALPPPKYIDIHAAGLTAHTQADMDALEAWRENECAMAYGPSYRVLRTLHVAGDTVAGLARAELPGSVLPPAVLDSVFQSLAFLSGAPHGGGMPWTIASLLVRRAVTEPVYLLSELTSDRHGANGPPGMVRGKASLVTAHGELVAQVNGITMKPPPSPASTRSCGLVEVLDLHPVPDSNATAPTPTHTYRVPEVPGDFDTQLAQVLSELRPLVHGKNRVERLRVLTSAGLAGGQQRPLHRAVWAMLTPLRQEHPGVAIQSIDAPEELLAALESPEAAVPVGDRLIRSGSGWALPARRRVEPAAVERVFTGSYLITGGLGGLARHVATWLAEQGAQQITLLGRRTPTPADQDHLQSLREKGATVTYQVSDITDPYLDLARDAWPYDAIFHTAGALADALLVTATAEQVKAVSAAKTAGVATIARYTQTSPDTEVILFSSIAAVGGRRGQGVYAAANAHMDGTAAAMRAGGHRWYSLQWGLWSSGMGVAIHAQAAAAGYPVIEPDHGRELLSLVLSLDPETYILSGQRESHADSETDTQGAAMTTTNTSHPATSSTAAALYDTVADVLGLDAVTGHEAPNDLGLDSMMAVEVSAAMADRGYSIDPGDLFSAATLAEVAAPVEAAGSAAEAPAPRPHPEPATPIPSASMPAATHTHAQTPPVWDQFHESPADPHPVANAIAAPSPHPQTLPWSGGAATATSPLPQPPPERLTRSLPNRVEDDSSGQPLAARLNEISAEDRKLVAAGEYFYEPVVTDNRGSKIEVDGAWMLNFASYSYLGLIEDDYIRRRAAGQILQRGSAAHGVRLLAGTADVHRRLEQRLAQFLGTEDAVVFSSGYMANMASIAALVEPGDVIIGDVLNHASILDGYSLSGADVIAYAHNDVRDLRRALSRAAGRRTLVVTDAVFSMDGDIADLPAIVQACREHEAILMVDEAHSLGVLGASGRGITEHYPGTASGVDILMGTLSKTIPSIGGYVAGSNDLIFALKNNARGWMFSAALPPSQAEAALAALEVIAAAPERVARLQRLSSDYRTRLQQHGFDTMNSATPVVPIRCGTSQQAIHMARLCQQRGLFVQPITYPTVSQASPRLRTIVNLTHTANEIEDAIDVFVDTGRRVGVI